MRQSCVPDSQPCEHNFLSVGIYTGRLNAMVVPNLSQFVFKSMLPLLPSFTVKTISDTGFQVGAWVKKTSIIGLSGSSFVPPITRSFPWIPTCAGTQHRVIFLHAGINASQFWTSLTTKCDGFKLLSTYKTLREAQYITITLQCRARVPKEELQSFYHSLLQSHTIFRLWTICIYCTWSLVLRSVEKKNPDFCFESQIQLY